MMVERREDAPELFGERSLHVVRADESVVEQARGLGWREPHVPPPEGVDETPRDVRSDRAEASLPAIGERVEHRGHVAADARVVDEDAGVVAVPALEGLRLAGRQRGEDRLLMNAASRRAHAVELLPEPRLQAAHGLGAAREEAAGDLAAIAAIELREVLDLRRRGRPHRAQA